MNPFFLINLPGVGSPVAEVVGVGFGMGLVLGICGVGGGIVLTPILILWFGLEPKLAVGTSVAFSLVTKLAGGVQHLSQGTVDRATVAWLALGSLPASLVTATVLNTWARRLVSEDLTRRLVLVAVLLSATAMTIRLLGLTRPLPWRLSGPPLTALGVGLGALFALTSVGSGSIVVTVLALVTPLGISSLVGTDVAHAALMAAVAFPAYLAAGHVDLGILFPLLLGSLPGVVVGSRLATRLPERVVKGTVLVAIWAVASRLV